MAFVAAAIQARIRRKKLAAKANALTQPTLDAADRNRILEGLKGASSTEYLSNFIESSEKEDAGGSASLIPEVVEFPPVRPHYLAPGHYIWLRRYFAEDIEFDPVWMEPYYKNGFQEPETVPAVVETAAEDEKEALALLESTAAGEKVELSPPGVIVVKDAPSWVWNYNRFVLLNQRIIASAAFNNLVVVAILVAGSLVGIMTYPEFADNSGVALLDLLVQIIFQIDVALKIFAEGVNPLNYWVGPQMSWNNFDCWLVVICWIPPEMLGGNVAFLRLLRLMRLFKLVSKVKQLQVIVSGLIKGLGSVTYILILMLLIMYLFAVLGCVTFRRNDPFHFGSIGVSMVTLFRMITFEAWSSIMHINYYGCNSQNLMVAGIYYGKGGGDPFYPGALGKRGRKYNTLFGQFFTRECWKPRKNAVIASIFCIVYGILTAFVLLSLFIGAVCGGMNDSLEAFKESEEKEAAAKIIKAKLKIDPNYVVVEALDDFFSTIDEGGTGEINAASLCTALITMGQTDATIEQAAELIKKYDKNGSGTMSFSEFVLIMTDGELNVKPPEAELEEKRKAQAELDGPAITSRKLAAAKKKVKEDAELEAALIALLRECWGYDENEKEEERRRLAKSPLEAYYLHLAGLCGYIAEHRHFVNLVTVAIIGAGISVGVSTELAKPGNVDLGDPGRFEFLNEIDLVILIVFTVDVVLKIIAEGTDPLHYLVDAWNKFDFFIVGACWVFKAPALSNSASLVSILRLLRLLRVLKLVKALPELRIIIEALIAGFGSISFVTVILFIFYYLYANIGMILFDRNDPASFGNLQQSLHTLFRLATFDAWSDLLYVNMYGCKNWGYTYGRKYASDFDGTGWKINKKKDMSMCNHSYGSGWWAVFYMISFAVLGSMVLLTLFIGIVCTAMEEAKEDNSNEKKRLDRSGARSKLLNINPGALRLYKTIFELLVDGEDGDYVKLKLLKTKIRVALLPVLGKVKVNDPMEDTPELSMTRLDLDKLIEVLKLGDPDHFQSTTEFEYPEFILLIDFMRRTTLDYGILQNLRDTFKVIQRAKLALKSEEEQSGGSMVSKLMGKAATVGGQKVAENAAATAPKSPSKTKLETLKTVPTKSSSFKSTMSADRTPTGAPGVGSGVGPKFERLTLPAPILRITAAGVIDQVYTNTDAACTECGITALRMKFLLSSGGLSKVKDQGESEFRFIMKASG